MYMVANAIHFKCVIPSSELPKIITSLIPGHTAHVNDPLTSSRRFQSSATDNIHDRTTMNVREWMSFGTGFDSPMHLILKTRCALFVDCVDVGSNLEEEVEMARSHFVAGDLNDLQKWFFVLHAQVVEDFAIIDEMAFMNTLMDLKPSDSTWLDIHQDILRIQEKFDLQWIPPMQYLTLRKSFFGDNGAFLSFLNRLTEDKWSHMEMAIDGKTQEYSDMRPPEASPKERDNHKEVATAVDGMLLHPSCSALLIIKGPSAAEIVANDYRGSSDSPITWM
jgi:hypothetical protein